VKLVPFVVKKYINSPFMTRSHLCSTMSTNWYRTKNALFCIRFGQKKFT